MALTDEERKVINNAFEIILKHTQNNKSASESVLRFKDTVFQLIDTCDRGTKEKEQAKKEEAKSTQSKTAQTKDEPLTFKEKFHNFIFGAKPEPVVKETPKPQPPKPEPPKPEVESPAELFRIEPYRGGAMITKYVGFDDKKIVIPKVIDGMHVYALGEGVFRNIESITEIIIPYGVISIGNFCFLGCSSLQKIKLPETLKVIGDSAFCGTQIRTLEIPEFVYYIGSSAFGGLPIEDVVLPKSLYAISVGTFSYCTKLKKITIPQGVARIGSDAFSSCFALSSVSLPTGLKEIEEEAFSRCINLKAIDIPPSVEKIGEKAFAWKNEISDVNRFSYLTTLEFAKWRPTIKCAPGSYAQEYARKYKLPMIKSDIVYGESKLNMPVYVANYGVRSKEKPDMNKLIDNMAYDWALLSYSKMVANHNLCIRSNNPDLKKSNVTFYAGFDIFKN
ncbi:MAG: leucine-rich repeat domain-containing protein [Clostridia bacterium]|nr:leucine-rich repeat domain-containing protein [Clostridia bacterium]